MKKTYFVFIILILLISQACKRQEGKVSIQNNISNVRVTDVSWVNYNLAGNLLPGQTSSERTIIEYEKNKFPKIGNVRFTMTANDKSIYLETIEEYRLDEGQTLEIVLNDSTEVFNPNQ